MEDVLQQRTTLLRAQEHDKQRLVTLEASIARKQHEIADLRDVHEKTMGMLRARYEKLAQQVQTYHNSLLQTMVS